MTGLPTGGAANEARRPSAPRLVRDTNPAAGAPPRRLRVVHCLDGFGSGGTELNAVRTLERLDRSRFDVTLVSLTADGPLRERYERAGIPVHVVPISNMYGAATLRQAAGLRAWLRRERVDVVHCHDIYTNVFGVACARAAGVPLVIASRRWWHALAGRAYDVANGISYRLLAHRVLANSTLVAAQLAAEGVPERKIVVIPNFLDETAFAPLAEAEREAALRRFGVPPDAVVVGAVAMLRAEKDLGTLVRAVATLAPAHPRLHLLLVGGGPCQAELAESARSLGIADRVHFAGYHAGSPNPHAYLDVSVLCSLHEGFPNTIIEAMAAGRPVVATRVGGVPDAAVDGVTALLTPPGDADVLAAALGRLVEDPTLRRRLGEAGRERAAQHFRAERVLGKLWQLYASVPARR